MCQAITQVFWSGDGGGGGHDAIPIFIFTIIKTWNAVINTDCRLMLYI